MAMPAGQLLHPVVPRLDKANCCQLNNKRHAWPVIILLCRLLRATQRVPYQQQ
jgi:hypothetical protein